MLDWFAANARDLPWRRTSDPYAIWVSEIMLQQTQVKTALPYWKRWMRELPTVESVAKASPDKIHKLWEGLGYYTRARNVQKAAKQIVANCRRRGYESQKKDMSEPPHVGSYKFPETFNDVLALPGIGRYTAGAICSIAFNQPTPILDGNVIRVLTRIFGIAQNPREKETNARLWKLAEELVYDASRVTHHGKSLRTRTKNENEDDLMCSHFNQSLMELGALICTPRNPQCRICPAKKLCIAYRENRVEELPNLGRRQRVSARHFAAFVVERNGRFLVRQRPAGVVNAHLWEFPNLEIAPSQGSSGRKSAHYSREKSQSRLTSAATTIQPRIIRAAREFGLKFHQANPLCTIKHSITRYRITLDAFHVQLKKSPGKAGGIWRTPAQMERLAFSSAHRKILHVLAAAR